MKVHERIHTGNISICYWYFFKIINLGEKPYQCNLCGQAFGGASNLYHHRQKHHPEAENEPPKRYTTSASLQQMREAREQSVSATGSVALYEEQTIQAMNSYAQLAAQAASEEQFRNFLAAKERSFERPNFWGSPQK